MNSIDRVGGLNPPVGLPSVETEPTRQRTPILDGRLPPVRDDALSSASTPVLPAPASFDASEMITKFLALRVKLGNEQLEASMKDVQFTGQVRKQQNDEIAKQMADAIQKMQDAQKGSLAAKIFGWIAVGLAVLAAIATGGALAMVAAGLAVTMAVLNETGVMQKMTDAIATSLMENQGMDSQTAKQLAGFITMGICIAVSLATLGGGAASAGAKVAETVDKAIQIAKTLAYAARFAQGAATVAQGGGQLYAGIKQYEAAELQADSAEIRKFQAKLQQIMDDEMDRIQAMVQEMNTVMSRAMAILNSQTDTSSNVIRHMG